MTKKSRTMEKLTWLGILFVVLTIVFVFLYRRYHASWMLSTYVTTMTTAYHFLLRLCVGGGVTLYYKNKDFLLDSKRFRLYSFEETLYQKWKVKKWKEKLITAIPERFDMTKRTPEELLHSVVEAEVVHRINMLLSFVPLLLIIPYGTAVVFIVTSILAALSDFPFVVIQRYNRPRVLKYKNMMDRRKQRDRKRKNGTADAV